MVHAKLHLICGNCGSDDQFTYEISEETDWDEHSVEYTYQTVYILCKNCGTLHSLDDNAQIETKKI